MGRTGLPEFVSLPAARLRVFQQSQAILSDLAKPGAIALMLDAQHPIRHTSRWKEFLTSDVRVVTGEKGKPIVRWGRKADGSRETAGLPTSCETAGLPNQWFGFFIITPERIGR